MPNLPIRNLGAVGVLTDPDPFNLPINAFTRAKNVRFDQGDVLRSPCFRDVASMQPSTETFVVTVVNDAGQNKFAIDGVIAPVLTLISGVTYTFNVADASVATHPWYSKILEALPTPRMFPHQAAPVVQGLQ